jgi:hypothetical protein
MLLRCVLFLCLLLPVVSAGVINYSFTGAVTNSSIGAYPNGTTFSGTFSYDNAATLSSSGTNFIYYTTNLGNLASSIGAQNYTIVMPLHENADQLTPDEDDLTLIGEVPAAQVQTVAPGKVYAEMVLRFHYPINTLYSGGIGLPASLPAGAVVDFSFAAYNQGPLGNLTERVWAEGTLRTYDQVVPEPSALGLAGAGLAALFALRGFARKRRGSNPASA